MSIPCRLLVLFCLLLAVRRGSARRALRGSMIERSANPLSEAACPWNLAEKSKMDIEVGFWVGTCGALQLCDKNHYIVRFELGQYGNPSDACVGPTGLINYCKENNRGSPFGYIQGVCSNGKKLATYQVAGARPTATVSSSRGFESINGSDVGTCCALGGFMGCGITHLPYKTQVCPAGQRIAGYVVGAQPRFDFAARELVENTVAEFSYIGLVCR